MRASIVTLYPHGPDELQHATIEGHLADCLACDYLRFDGCGECQPCAVAWDNWRKRVIYGNCKHFAKP